ncbi:MAG TPA: hypothetical protein CFH81_01905 [Sulfurovum sp. UBA12169]|nr:MAG TPA: hypothetical protein CFH81_01905 [Sulfurovum sp. UBA12169]
MKIAVSSCLLGESIRYDGGHKHDRFITDELGKYAQFVPFCPEHVAFGTPRPTIKVVMDQNTPLIISNKNGADMTEALKKTSEEAFEAVNQAGISGIIFKAKSPSCGLGSTIAYLSNGYSIGKTDGMFAAMCKARFPLLPMEEEGRLCDPWLRENFIMQLFAYDHFEQFKTSSPNMGDLVAFHQTYKFLLHAKDETSYRVLGTIVGNMDKLAFDEVLSTYERLFKETIGIKSSIKKTRNVLEHMAGFLKKELNAVEKTVLHEQIKDYADRIIPLIVPLSTLDMLAKKYEAAYLLGQKFLSPYPKELALRSDLKSGK